MKTISTKFFVFVFFVLSMLQANGQEEDRLGAINKQLDELSVGATPGLNEKVDFSVSGATIQEFLRGIAEAHSLNISVDPTLDIRIYNNFSNESVKNVLLFLVNEYSLDIRFVGSIMSFYRYTAPPPPPVKKKPKEIVVEYKNAEELLSLDLKNDTVTQVAEKITRTTGKNIILSPEIPQNKLLNVFIQDMKFDNALDKMAYANALIVTKTDDGFYLLEPLEKEETIAGRRTTSPSGTRGRTAGRPGSLKDGQFYIEITDSLGEKYVTFEAVNFPIVDAINEVSAVTGNDYFLFSEPKGNTTTKVERVTYDDFMSFLLQGTAHTYKIDEGIYLVGERQLEGLRDTRMVKLQYRSMTDVMNAIPADLREGVEVKEFEELNSFILSGSSPQIQEIEAFIEEIDQVVPMVLIEVIMIDIKRTKTFEAGIEAGTSDSVNTGGSLLPGLNYVFGANEINNSPINIGRVTPDFYVKLNALDQQDYANVHSTPKLSTLNGHEATLRIGETRYYKLQTQNVVGSLNPQTVVTEQFNAVQADLAITIRPVVSGDDQVTLEIEAEISDFIGTPPENSPPPSSTSQFNSLVRVKNDEMILLGGLERIAKSESGSGVPFISRVPVLKWFFGNRSKTNAKTISVIFIKPTIIY